MPRYSDTKARMRSSICCQRLVSCGYSVLSRSNTQVSTELKSWTGVLEGVFIGRRMHRLDATRKGRQLFELHRGGAGGGQIPGGKARRGEPVAAAVPVIGELEPGAAGAQDGGTAPVQVRRRILAFPPRSVAQRLIVRSDRLAKAVQPPRLAGDV